MREEKYYDVYDESSMAMIRELPSPEETSWRADDINDRGEKLAKFALDRWGIETGAYVNADRFDPGVMENDIRDEIIRQVREDFGGSGALNNLPTVVVGETLHSDSWNIIERCPSCEGTQFKVSQDDSSLNISCVCGEPLSSSLYKIKLKDYS